MTATDQTMTEVVQRLRDHRAAALGELVELQTAVTEILESSQRLTTTLREIAGEAAALALQSGSASPQRLRNLSDYARHASTTAECQTAAFQELARGLEGWAIHVVSVTSA
jgi:hypothetical protein